MFNLENAIAAWRRQMQKAGLTPNVIDELETHLRDELDEQMRAGSAPENAFHTAVQLLGDASKLQDEFAKSTHADPQPKQKLMRAICFISAGAIVLINSWSLMLFDLGLGDRVLGAFAIAATALYLGALPFFHQVFSPAAYLRFLHVIKIASNLVALFPIILLLSLVHVIDLDARPIATLILWLFVAAVAVSIIVIGFGRDNGWGGTGASGAPGPFVPAGPSGRRAEVSIPASTELKSPHLLENARAEALRLGHDFIGTEHVLLALLKEEEGANLLRPWQASYESVRAEVEKIVFPQTPQNIASNPALTPRARKALGIAKREARRSHQPLVSADHILSGLLLEGTGIAAIILNKLRVAF
jgi:hypothetical protein